MFQPKEEDEDYDVIPTSQLRQYLHNNTMTDALRDKLFNQPFDSPSSLSSILSEDESCDDPSPVQPKPKKLSNPVHFTFDDIPDDPAETVDFFREEEIFPSFSHTPLNNGEKIEPIPVEADSLCDGLHPSSRLSLVDIVFKYFKK